SARVPRPARRSRKPALCVLSALCALCEMRFSKWLPSHDAEATRYGLPRETTRLPPAGFPPATGYAKGRATSRPPSVFTSSLGGLVRQDKAHGPSAGSGRLAGDEVIDPAEEQ